MFFFSYTNAQKVHNIVSRTVYTAETSKVHDVRCLKYSAPFSACRKIVYVISCVHTQTDILLIITKYRSTISSA